MKENSIQTAQGEKNGGSLWIRATKKQPGRAAFRSSSFWEFKRHHQDLVSLSPSPGSAPGSPPLTGASGHRPQLQRTAGERWAPPRFLPDWMSLGHVSAPNQSLWLEERNAVVGQVWVTWFAAVLNVGERRVFLSHETLK